MRRKRLSMALILMFAGFSFALADAQADEGFEPLFNGKDLTGWIEEGNAGFVVKDGMLVCNGSGNWPTWLRTTEVFENFVLRLEYKTRYGAESGVFFHAPLHGRISHVGYEVQIGGSGRLARHSTGAIFDAIAPLKSAPRQTLDEKDAKEQFDELEITVTGHSHRRRRRPDPACPSRTSARRTGADVSRCPLEQSLPDRRTTRGSRDQPREDHRNAQG